MPAEQPHDAQYVEQKITESLKQNPKDMAPVYEQLRDLESHERSAAFQKDLSKINADLHKSGILPHLQIVEDKSKKEGFGLADDRAKADDHGSKPLKHAPLDAHDGQTHHRGHPD